MAHTACLVCFISTVNGRSNKKRKEKKKAGASSRHITNLKQSILETFDIYGFARYHPRYCLPYWPWPNERNRNNPICVTLPKVAKASTVTVTDGFANERRQLK
jgi:hypothetical protein